MSYNFYSVDRDQAFLFPPSIRDWIPPGDLVRFIIETVEKLPIEPFFNHYGEDGTGNTAYNPQMRLSMNKGFLARKTFAL